MLAAFTLRVLLTLPGAMASASPGDSTAEVSSLPQLRIDEPVRGAIERTDPIVKAQGVRADISAALRGKSFRIEVPADTRLVVDMRSHYFDSYLVIRDRSGDIVHEDDNGLLAAHARVTLDPRPQATVYRVDACASRDRVGPFELLCTTAIPAALAGPARAAAALDDARAGVAVVTELRGAEHADTAYALNNLAERLFGAGRYADCRPLFERALAIREAALGEHRETAASLDNMGIVLKTLGDFDAARGLYERALAMRTKICGADHPETARSLNNQASFLFQVGDMAGAEQLYRRCLAIRTQRFGPEDLLVARTLGNLAAVMDARGLVEDSRDLYARALELHEAALGTDHPRTARMAANFAGILEKLGEFDEAERLHRRALADGERALGPGHPQLALNLNNIATLCQVTGRLGEARQHWERALAILEPVVGKEHPLVLLMVGNLGVALLEQGSFEESHALFERAYRACEELHGLDHPETALAMGNLVVALYRVGRHDESMELAERALPVQERVLGPEHPHFAHLLRSLSNLYNRRGDIDRGRELQQRSLAILEKVFGSSHVATVASLADLALAESNQGRAEAAIPRFEKVIALRTEILGATHPLVAQASLHRALALLNVQRRDEAWTALRTAIERYEMYWSREAWAFPEFERIRFARTQLDALSALVFLALGSSSTDQRDAYAAVLRWKGEAARSLLRTRRGQLASLEPRERSMVEQLEGVQSSLSGLLYRAGRDAASVSSDRISKLRATRQRLERELARSVGPVAPGRQQVASVLASLPDDSAVIDFVLYRPFVVDGERSTAGATGKEGPSGDWGARRIAAFVARSGDQNPVAIDLGESRPVEELIHEYRREMQSEAPRGIAVAEEEDVPIPESAMRLRRLIWDPLADRVGAAQTVFVVPDGLIGALPFEALPLVDKSYLIEHHAFVYLQSAGSLATLGAHVSTDASGSPGVSFLCVGGVDYGRRAGLDWRDGSSAGPTAALPALAMVGADATTPVVRGSDAPQWATLAGTRAEATTLIGAHEDLFRRRERLALLGTDATEERLKYELPRHEVVHIATHGFFEPAWLEPAWSPERDPASPDSLSGLRMVTGHWPGLLSGLVFAGAGQAFDEDRDDGYLTAEEISFLDLGRCDLVVLSACETGLGRPEATQGMLGLRRTLRQAGARTVISSLWKVDDAATSTLMQSFYERLWQRGASKLEALRGAQLEMLERNRVENGGAGMPSTWGAFVLDGAWF